MLLVFRAVVTLPSPEDEGLMLGTGTGADVAGADAELLGAGNSNPIGATNFTETELYAIVSWITLR